MKWDTAEIVLQAAPIEGHEKSNGEAEDTVKQVAGLVQTLPEHFHFFAGVQVPAKHPLVAWMVERVSSRENVPG